MQYDHLDTTITQGKSIANGAVLGKTKNWGKLSCYLVTSDGGVHVHFGAKNSRGNGTRVDRILHDRVRQLIDQ